MESNIFIKIIFLVIGICIYYNLKIILLVINYNKATAHNITGVYNSAITEQHPGKILRDFPINEKVFIIEYQGIDESTGREIYIITDRKAKEKGNIIQFKIEKLQGEQPNIIMKALGDQSLGWIELIKK